MFGLSGDFISKITRIGSVPENVILVTADVELYPRDHTFMTSMKNAQFLHPPISPFSACPNGSELGNTSPPLDVKTWATNPHPL